MSHIAELIAVGTELLLGNIANTNAQTLSQSLSALGVNVFWHTVVGDNPERLKEALDIARRRCDILITTGGLGPTYDDLTKQTICEAFGKPLILHPDILEDIRSFYESALHVPMPENNTQQAELPEDCTIFDNPAPSNRRASTSSCSRVLPTRWKPCSAAMWSPTCGSSPMRLSSPRTS